MTRVSVVVPVLNGGETMAHCLDALRRSLPPPDEIIVVDDASSDGSAMIAAAHGARVVTVGEGPRGPGAARNRGAAAASGGVVMFVDADVDLHADAVGIVRDFFSGHPGHAACFGSYDVSPSAPNFVSQFKNLMHHHVHQVSPSDAETFWAGCGAVRRDAFLDLGGFDETYRRPMIEDIELGARLRRAGHRIALLKELQGTHRKRWTMMSMIRTDIRDRALPWTRLILARMSLPRTLNLRVAAQASALFVWLGLASAAAAVRRPWALVPAAAALGGMLTVNAGFYGFLARERGAWFAVRAVPLHALYFAYASAAFAIGACAHALRRRRRSRGRRRRS